MFLDERYRRHIPGVPELVSGIKDISSVVYSQQVMEVVGTNYMKYAGYPREPVVDFRNVP